MRYFVITALLLALGTPARADSVAVGVASNFVHTLRELTTAFEAQSGHSVRASVSSSGKLYAQISNGAPFDVFLSADAERPARLEADGLTVAGTRFTYATGRLALWSADPRYAGRDCVADLVAGRFSRIATANPATAPYGAAAVQTLAALEVPTAILEGRVAHAENIAQALQFVVSGSASLGFIARAQLVGQNVPAATCHWDVPPEFHDPIAQQAVLLVRGAGNPAATAFMAFLAGDDARRIITAGGYGVD